MRRTYLQQLSRQLIHAAKLIVPHKQPLIGVEHAQSFAHIVERGLECHILNAKALFMLPQPISLLGRLPLQTSTLGDILVRRDPPAPRDRGALHHYGSTIVEFEDPGPGTVQIEDSIREIAKRILAGKNSLLEPKVEDFLQ